jgi:uncharacterized membrane protein
VNQDPSAVNTVHNGMGGISQGLAWIAQGHHEVQKHKSLWLGMTAVYLMFGFLLKLIPFMGDLLLILITPMLLAGVVWGRVQTNQARVPPGANGTPSSMPTLLQSWVIQPAQELVRIFTDEYKVFGAVLLGIVTLGLVMLVKIAGYLLIGGSMVSGLTAGLLNAPQITTLLGMLVVAILYLILTMALFYSVPLTVLGNREPLAAISESFSTCRKNPAAVLTLCAPFFGVYLILMAVFARYHWLGNLLVISAGFFALPLFVAAAICSYHNLHSAQHSSSRR